MPRLNPNSFADPAWAIVTKGSEEYANCQFAEAIASFTTALNSFTEQTPSAAIMETYICRGAAFGRSGQDHSAIEDFTKAIALDPKGDMAFYNRGISHQTLGLHDLAIDDFSRVIELRPKYVSGYIRRGVCLKRLQKLQDARRDFMEAKRLIAAKKPADQQAQPRPKRLADVPLRFPPPPGTRFYVFFAAGLFWDGRPLEEKPTVVADSPQDAVEQLLDDGKLRTDPRLKYAHVVWMDHNGNARTRVWCLEQVDSAGAT